MKYLTAILLGILLLTRTVMPAYAQEFTLPDVEAAIIQEDYKKANEMAKALVQSRLSPSESAMARYYLGLSELRLGNYALAYDVFKKLADDRPSIDVYERASIGVIDALYMQGQYESALKDALTLMNKHSHSEMMSLIYLKVARSSLKLARWGQAKQYLQKIMAEFPNSFESRVARQLLEEKQYYTVQVGAFLEQPRAQTLVQELIKRGEYAYIIETLSPDGKKFFRVRVGQMRALKDARTLETKLSGLGYPTLIYP